MEKIIIEYTTGGEYEWTHHTKAVNYKSLQDAKDDFELLFWDQLKKNSEFEKQYREAEMLLSKYTRDNQHKSNDEKIEKIFKQREIIRELWNNRPNIITLGEAKFDLFDFVYRKGKNEEDAYMAPSFTLLEDWYQQQVARSKNE